MFRDKISEEDPTPWVDVQEKLFPRSSKQCLYEKLLKKFGMTQRIIRERYFLFFISLYCRCVTYPFSESGRTDGFRIILIWRNGQIYTPIRLVLVTHMVMVINM